MGFNEVLRTARIVYDTHYDLALIALVFIALVFLVLTFIGNATMGILERKFRIPGLQAPGSGKRRRDSSGSLRTGVLRRLMGK